MRAASSSTRAEPTVITPFGGTVRSWILVAALCACTSSGKDTDPDTDSDSTNDSDTTPSGDWTTVASGLPGALLAITGTSATDVWSIGADGDGSGPMLVHYDGAAWSRIDLGITGDMWWLWQAGPDDLFLVGTGGRVLRYTPSTNTFTTESLDNTLTLWGVWGSSANDVWAVGGNPSAPSYGAQVWHYDGAAWTRQDIPDTVDPQMAMYKVWGSSATDVWVVGSGGKVIRYDGAAWTEVVTNTTLQLFTVHGTGPNDVYVVGGAQNGAIFHWDGTNFVDESPGFAQTIQGIWATGDLPFAAGWGGFLYNRDTPANMTDDDPFSSIWTEDARGPGSLWDFHAVWVDPDGGQWAVGGAIKSAPMIEGTLIYGGDAPPAAY
jgi:hypothetical protein